MHNFHTAFAKSEIRLEQIKNLTINETFHSFNKKQPI